MSSFGRRLAGFAGASGPPPIVVPVVKVERSSFMGSLSAPRAVASPEERWPRVPVAGSSDERRLGLSLPASGLTHVHQQNWARRVLHDPRGNTPQENPRQPAPAMGRHRNQIDRKLAR